MTVLCELYDKTPSPLLIGIYWKALEPFTDEQCETAFNSIICSSRFFPKPADFIEFLQGTNQDKATQAWIKTVNAIRKYGNYTSVKFDDPVIHAVIEFMGGWANTGEWHDDNLRWKEKEFLQLYKVMEKRGEPYPLHLPGLIEVINQSKGYDVQNEIAFIGRHKTTLKSSKLVN
ncbi:MAG: DUF6475 domain-containing protein [Smithellaceae bacterium]|nr:DUF6475 domain-containing protein [Smithellaceae bacterium]